MSIVAVSATLPEPSNDTALAVMSPLILKFLALARVVAVSALPVNAPVTLPCSLDAVSYTHLTLPTTPYV